MNKEELLSKMRGSEIQFKPSQERVSFPVIVRIHKKMEIGLAFDSIQVSENSIIVNGHHRYLASLFTKAELDNVPCPLTSAKKVTEWALVELVDEDWDTTEKIKMLNEQDAKYNGIPIERLLELIA